MLAKLHSWTHLIFLIHKWSLKLTEGDKCLAIKYMQFDMFCFFLGGVRVRYCTTQEPKILVLFLRSAACQQGYLVDVICLLYSTPTNILYVTLFFYFIHHLLAIIILQHWLKEKYTCNNRILFLCSDCIF